MYEIGQVGVCRCLGFLSPCLLADGNETAYWENKREHLNYWRQREIFLLKFLEVLNISLVKTCPVHVLLHFTLSSFLRGNIQKLCTHRFGFHNYLKMHNSWVIIETQYVLLNKLLNSQNSFFIQILPELNPLISALPKHLQLIYTKD